MYEHSPVPYGMITAMQLAAARHGVPLGRELPDIARAVLEYFDETCRVTVLFSREVWESEKYQRGIILDMEQRLIEQVLKRKAVPVALPTQSVKYFAGFPGHECPKGDHDIVGVSLSVGVRYCEVTNG